MDEEELEQPKKITIGNFFESIQKVDKVANRALKKTGSNLLIINKNKFLIDGFKKSIEEIKKEVEGIKKYIEDTQEDKLFSQEDQEQKIKRLERLQGIDGKEIDPTESAAGTTDDSDFEKQAADTFKKALKNPNIMSILTGLIGMSVAGLLGAGAKGVKDVKERTFSEKTGGFLDFLTDDLTDFDKKGDDEKQGRPRTYGRAIGGVVDFFTANMFDLDKQGDFTTSREKLKELEELKEKRRVGLNQGGPVFDNDNDTSNNNKDSVPAMLTPGEFVVTKDAVDKIGVDTLKGINASVGATNEPTKIPKQEKKYTMGYQRGQITPEQLVVTSTKFIDQKTQKRMSGQGGRALGSTTKRQGGDTFESKNLFGENYAGISRRTTTSSLDYIPGGDGVRDSNLKTKKIMEKDIVSVAVEDIIEHQDDLLKRIRRVKGYENVTIEDVLNSRVDMDKQKYARIIGHSDAAKATDKKKDEARKLDKEKYGDGYYNYFDESFNQGGLVEGAKKMYSSEIEENKSKNNLKPLLDMIGSGESDNDGGYTAMFPSESYPKMLDMTINEVIEFQKEKLKDGRKSVAVGRYQMLYPEDYAAAAGLPLTAKFTPKNQDKMVISYLKKNRKLNEFLQGKITNEQFSEELAEEFGTFKSASGFVLPNNTGSIDFPKMMPVFNEIKNELKPNDKSSDNLQSVIESKSNDLAQSIFTPPSVQNKVNLLPIPVNQSQPQPVNGNVPVAAPQNSPQVTTTPVASTMSSVSFINMISNKQLSIG